MIFKLIAGKGLCITVSFEGEYEFPRDMALAGAMLTKATELRALDEPTRDEVNYALLEASIGEWLHT